MSLDGPARRSDVEASAEPAVEDPLRMARQPTCARLPVGTCPRPGGASTSAGRDTSGRTAPMYAAQRGCKEVVEALLEHEKGMSDSQSHSALLGTQEWAHRGCQDRYSSRGPDRRGWRHRAHAGRRQRRR